MSDTPSYRLRNADIENLDLSQFSKDYSAEELAAVRQALFQKQKEQQEKFNALPVVDQAKIYVGEKFGDLKKTVDENPELLGYGVAALAAKGAYDTAKPMVTATVEKAKGIYGRMIGQPKAEVPASTTETFTPDKVVTPEQATQQQVEQGKIKTGKAGGSISPESSTLIANEEKGMNVSQTKRLEDYSKLMAETESKLGPATRTTGTGLAAYVGEGDEKAKIRKNYASIKDVPPDLVWIPGGNNLGLVRNAVGPEAYLENLKKTGGFPLSNQDAIAQSREINRSLGRMTREEAKAAGAPLGQAAKSITKEVSGSKLVKVAGVGGALISLADLALAGQKAKEGEYGEAAKIGIPAAAGLVNPAAGGLTGAAAEPGIAASQLRAVAPVMGMFADISQQKISKYLKDKEQAQKVGAGRGIAPPSDYMR